MSTRLALASSKGCDGVDPDNVDGYDNDSGFDLTPSTALDYLTSWPSARMATICQLDSRMPVQ
jgi:hypothetical protein